MPAGTGAPPEEAVELVLYPRGGDPIRARVELRPMGHRGGSSGLLLDVTEAHARSELEEVQRVLSIALSSARTPEEAAASMVRALPRASVVLGARVIEVIDDQPRLVAHATSTATHHPVPVLEVATTALVGWRDDLGADDATLHRVDDGPLPHARARFLVDGPTRQVLEVLFALDVPGRSALPSRLPALVDQVVRHERRLAEQARFEALFERAQDALVLLDGAGRVARCNALATRLWPSLAGGTVDAWPDALRAVVRHACARGADAVGSVGWQQGAGERSRDLEASVAPVLLPEGRGVLVSARDVTARRAAERSLEAALVDVRTALAEREVLLKEIHHRVKNNLQIVSSLLSMRADRGASAETQAALEESAHRVRSLALVHQQLYGGEDLARIPLDAYVRTLAMELCGSLAPTATVAFETMPTEVDAERAIPCGLILNELIVNALKHGRGPDGRIAVHVAVESDDDAIRLTVADTGPGMPTGFDPATLSRATSLGMRLIAALTRQLGATLRLGPGPGARFLLVVPARGPAGTKGPPPAR